jgi:hypothetical protein
MVMAEKLKRTLVGKLLKTHSGAVANLKEKVNYCVHEKPGSIVPCYFR